MARRNPYPSALEVAREVKRAAQWVIQHGHYKIEKGEAFPVPANLSTRALDWINRHPGDFRRLVASMRAKNPAKFERCVRKVKKRPGVENAYAVCTAALKKRSRNTPVQLRRHKAVARRLKRKKNPPRHWYIHAQKGGHGPVMLYNGRSFSQRPNTQPLPFSSANAAMYKARHLLGKYHHILSRYKIWVSDQYMGAPTVDTRVNPRRRNPEKLDQAAQKLEDFTGHPATHVERARTRSDEKTGLVIGEMKAVEYLAARKGIEGGKTVRWHHKFRKGSRPLLAVSTDGKQLHIVGGQYEFTEAGIEDR